MSGPGGIKNLRWQTVALSKELSEALSSASAKVRASQGDAKALEGGLWLKAPLASEARLALRLALRGVILWNDISWEMRLGLSLSWDSGDVCSEPNLAPR